MRNLLLGMLLGLATLGGPAHAAYSVGATQVYALPAPAWQVRIGDFTGDRRNDVAVLTSEDGVTKVHVYVQKADGTLTNPPRVYAVPSGAISMAMGDLNRDGIQDLVVGTYDSITVLSSNVAAPVPLKVTTWATSSHNSRIRLARINRDDLLDVVSVNLAMPATPIHYFRGDGRGAINPVPQRLSSADAIPAEDELEVADVDGNGATDIVTTQDGAIRVLYNDSRSGFDVARAELIDPGFWVEKASAHDINRDGRKDLVVTGSSSGGQFLYVYYQQASGERFPQASVALDFANPQWGLAFNPFLAHDFDKDGSDDLMVAHQGGSAQFGLFTNDGQGLGAEVLQAAAMGEVLDMAAGDINGDGCTDLVAGGYYNVIGVAYGSGCVGTDPALLPDLKLTLAANAHGATVQLATIAAVTPVQEPLVQIRYTVEEGTLTLATLPANCVDRSTSNRQGLVECLVDSLAGASNATLGIPFAVVTSPGRQARVAVSAQAYSDTPERSKANNAAATRFGVAPTAAPTADTVKSRGPGRTLPRAER